MSVSSLEKLIKSELPELKLRNNEPMSAHTSLKIGGPAELFAEPETETELVSLIALLRHTGARYFVLGNGTNLLFDDAGYRGTVIKTAGLDELSCDGDAVTAGAGVTLARLAVFARDASLSGLEFAHGIPGSLGGGVVMNAGAYGGELKDVVMSVRCLGADGSVIEHAGAENGFAYRASRYQQSGETVLSARLRLIPGDRDAVTAKMAELMARRAASQPLDKPSAGSTFKRPARGYAAALIDEAGLKGYAIGGAQVSEKHAGFVINRGGATSADILALMDHIRETVLRRSGIELEPEVRIIRG